MDERIIQSRYLLLSESASHASSLFFTLGWLEGWLLGVEDAGARIRIDVHVFGWIRLRLEVFGTRPRSG